MDADVEMVKRGNDEVGPTEDLRADLSQTESSMIQQNRLFTTGLVAFLVVMLFLIGTIYREDENYELPGLEYNPGHTGEIPDGFDNSVVAEGTATMKHHKHTKHDNHMQTWMDARKNHTDDEQHNIQQNDTSSTETEGEMHSSLPTLNAVPSEVPSIVPSLDPSVNPSTAPSEPSEEKGPSIPEESTAVPAEVQAWLDATVTEQDGVKYEIVKQLSHDTKSFTEGLTYADGKLYESVGLNRQSAVLVLDPDTGDTLERYDMDRKYFGEGLTYADGKFYQLTYRKKKGFIYNANDLSKTPGTFMYDTTTGEGWGMTYDADRHEIIVSDGSSNLLIWDPVTLTEKRRVPVTRLSGGHAKQINELEYWRGRVIANLWYSDTVIVIHPETGAVEKEYDMSSLWPKSERRQHGADVLNGISVSEDPDLLYFTGKKWDRMFLIRLLH